MTNEDENRVTQKALQWVKDNENDLIQEVAGWCRSKIEHPVSIFMAGSPGAGKTEFSKNLLEGTFGRGYSKYIVRIDPDEVRDFLPQYEQGNAHVFQHPVSVAVEKIHDHVLKAQKNFLLDGTFANQEKARKNVRRSVKKKRSVLIQFVYQDPEIAWDFTQKREAIEGRNIPKEVFAEQFITAQENVNTVKKEFGRAVQLDLITRNIRTGDYDHKFNIDNIDTYIGKKYTEAALRELL